jgi:cell wall-associated NlpC family hydrolase
MTDDHTAVPILYRTSEYVLLGQGRQLALKPGSRVERSGQDGKSVMGPKWVTWVHLQDKATQQTFYVLNTHMLVGAENSVRIRKANPRRVALYERQLAALTSLADEFRADGSTVYATCDCNVNYSPKVRPVVTMAKHDMIPSWQSLDSPATHGKRAIDYVWSTEAPASQITGREHGSDHAFLAVTFLPSATNVITGGSGKDTARTRVVTDPTSNQTYEVPIPTGRNGTAINFALNQLGETWKWGSHGPAAWDCSGLTAGAWRAAGVSITPQSDAQERTVRHVRLAKARPGDLVWHKGYVGIYLGTVGDQRVVVGSVRAQGAVVIHTLDDSEIKAVLRPRA